MKQTSFSVLAAALIAFSVARTPVLAQDEEAPATGETTTVVPLEPDAPAQPPVLPLAPRLPLQPGEALYEGTIEGVSFAEHRFTMRVTSVTLPDGSQQQLATPRYQVVHYLQKDVAAAPYPTDGTPPRLVSAGLLWTRHAVAVVGPGPEPGPGLEASLIELGEIQDVPAVLPVSVKRTTYFGGVWEHVAGTGLRIGPKFGITDIGGVSERPANPTSDHPRGLALDFMVGRNAKRGDNVAAYFESNMGVENVAYIIWKDHLVYPGARTDWAALPVDYGPGMTERHMDHVHVSFLDQPLTPGPWLTPAIERGAKLAARGGEVRKLGSRRKRRKATKPPLKSSR